MDADGGKTVRLAADCCEWREYGPRRFGGLVGEALYDGELAGLLPLLSLAEWTGLGKKTSFGFGVVTLHIEGGARHA